METSFRRIPLLMALAAGVALAAAPGFSSESGDRSGIDERTALVVDASGHGEVLGTGSTYVVKSK